ncbi:hypothetical protein ACFFGR_09210 [Arthrobacter liuii]|uniref:Uncharacterized protein n=1 Tax=Arthrobacter liuii TaxID=1476996 RepID=A0ABQ2AQW5_9MICC|nr:hypothetical protein [Arthrobacter liuii]GGH93769.1 hypothetical protein GCM10007170_15410 [Arthrobacter liuii]
MTNFTYPQNRTPAGELSALIVFVDPGLTTPATLTDTNGNPLPGGRVTVGADGQWPLFQCTAPTLYTEAPDGSVSTLAPALSTADPVAVTGSRGTATATVVENLIQALIAAGVPILDQTTA